MHTLSKYLPSDPPIQRSEFGSLESRDTIWYIRMGLVGSEVGRFIGLQAYIPTFHIAVNVGHARL